MSVEAFLQGEYAALLGHPLVHSSQILRYTVNRLDGYLRARCHLTNGDYLEVALHVNGAGEGIQIDGYRYQWMDADQRELRRRWDNTAHFPNLPGFPYHGHIGESIVEPSPVLSLAQVLDLIASLLSDSGRSK